MFLRTSVASFVLILSFATTVATAQPAIPNVCVLDVAGMDPTVLPGQDFYRYANGAWMEKNSAPPGDSAYWGPGRELDRKVTQQIRDLIRDASERGISNGSDERKIVDYYESYLDQDTIEAKGLTPLKPTLERIAAISDRTMLARALGETLRADVDPLNLSNEYTSHLFGLWVAQDLHEPTRNVPYLLQGGTGLENRDDYFSHDAIRDKYEAHVAAVLRLAGFPDPEAQATRVLALERAIAWAQVDEDRIPIAQQVDMAGRPDHIWTRADFATKAPGLDWAAYFEAAGLHANRFIVWQPRSATGEAALVATAPLTDWKSYLAFHAIDEASPVLSASFSDEWFAFYKTTLNGTVQQKDRWEQAVEATNDAMGFAVGRLYVARYFPAESKAKIEQLVQNLLATFALRIKRLDWMAPDTKAAALAKLETLRVGVGYPNHWRDYSALEVVRGDALRNWLRAQLFEYHRNVEKLNESVDRGEWWLAPQTVNAVNLPLQNALNFPAAILQPPFFDPGALAAANYGAIGATIGHEISHSFDPMGAKFTATGELRDWWTKEDHDDYHASIQRLVKQFNHYNPTDDLGVDGKVNGQTTKEENVADLVGLSISYDAWKQSLSSAPSPECANFTGDQRFFIAYAQSWREGRTPESLARRLKTDIHAPAVYRVYTVRNLDAWYHAFDIKEDGDGKKTKLYLPPGQRARIWE